MLFSQNEHEALTRLLGESAGFAAESRRIAYWLQAWQQAGDKRAIPRLIQGLSSARANDVLIVASAAMREQAGPGDLGRPDYNDKLQFAAIAHPLPRAHAAA